MDCSRSVSKHVQRYHYALVLVSSASGGAIDRPTLLQTLQRELGAWFGTTGGVNSNEVEVVSIAECDPKVGGGRRVSLRFPRSIASQLLPTLPLLDATDYRIHLLSDSSDLSRLGGVSGRGKTGYEDWKRQVLA